MMISDTSRSMPGKIVDIFTENLPWISPDKAEAFADGMLTYHNAFKTRRDEDMNYKSAPDYHTEWNFIMTVETDDLWVHTPHFRKVVGLALGELFKTKITMFSPQNTADIEHSVMFIDAHLNRWGVSLLRSETNPDKFRICARFPLSDTKVQPFKTIKEKEMSDPAFNKSEIHILVQDTTSLWYPSPDDVRKEEA
jgi:hypothetical protein